MPRLLRNIRKAKWYKNENVVWLPKGELQADALADLNTKDNILSVWQVNDDRANLTQIVVAIAAGRDLIAHFDYALLDRQALPEIEISYTKGSTADEQVNSWHCDIREISASKLMALAQAIQAEAEIKRIPEKTILELVAQALTNGQLDRARLRLKRDQMQKVDEFIASNP